MKKVIYIFLLVVIALTVDVVARYVVEKIIIQETKNFTSTFEELPEQDAIKITFTPKYKDRYGRIYGSLPHGYRDVALLRKKLLKIQK